MRIAHHQQMTQASRHSEEGMADECSHYSSVLGTDPGHHTGWGLWCAYDIMCSTHQARGGSVIEIAHSYDQQHDALVNLSERFHIQHTPLQAQVIRSIDQGIFRKWAIKSCHGWGKTYVASSLVVDWLSRHPKPLVITTAPTDRQVRDILWKEIKRKARPLAKQLGWDILPDAARIKKNDETIALGFSTTDEAKFEGYHEEFKDAVGDVHGQLLVIVDEAKGVEDRIMEAIDTTGPQMLIYISTPGHPTGRFYEAFHQPKLYGTWTINGELHNEATGERVKQSWIADMQELYGRGSPIYCRRVLADFSVVSESPYLDAGAIAACIDTGVPRGEPKVLAIDWGKRIDYTTGVAAYGKHIEVPILPCQDDYMTTVDRIDQLHQKEGYQVVICDLGAGEAQVEELKRRGVPAVGFRFTTRSKLDIMANMKLMIEARELCLPGYVPELKEQLLAFEQLPRKDGSVSLNAPTGQHDDLVDALAMAVSRLKAPSRRVRVGRFSDMSRKTGIPDGGREL